MTQSRMWALRVGCLGIALSLSTALAPMGASAEEGTGNQVFFKGGFVAMNSNRAGEAFTDVGGAGGLRNDGSAGYYVGAGLDLLLTKDVWGMVDKTAALGEIGLQFNRLNSHRATQAAPALAGVGTPAVNQVQLTMMTINVSPKIKFMEGSAFRPWIIPIGLDFHVISPPSNGTQYLDVGVQFGAGFEYQVWKAIKVGMDARYHLTANMTNTTNSYFQVGPYVGISF